MKLRAVFLDRDGVLIKTFVRDGKPFAATRFEEMEILPGVAEALERLHDAGFLNVVVTNQPDVATGKTKREAVEAMHAELRKKLPIDAIKVCFHDDAANCACRKPKPGMLIEAANELGIDLKKSFLVGDRWRDIEAGQAAGCKSYFVDYRYQEKRPDKPYVAVESLPEAAALILQG